MRGVLAQWKRLSRIFLRDERGRRPVYGGREKFQADPHWRDHILFYEYFHGDNGAGLGASHQTGWTGLVAKLVQLFGLLDAKKSLEAGKAAAFVREGNAQNEGLTCSALALSNQHARVADRAVRVSWSAGDAGRHTQRRTGSSG